jgi:tRNA (cytidine/uridine-2'-O-)-methyltransferase
MFHIVLFEPEIPPNTGNVIRLCANTGATLHLIKPLGFRLDDKSLQRSGLDYHDLAWCRFTRISTRASRACGPPACCRWRPGAAALLRDFSFRAGDALLFGPETRGLAAPVQERIGRENSLFIPMRPRSRSLNLSNAVALVAYEAWRQLGAFDGGAYRALTPSPSATSRPISACTAARTGLPSCMTRYTSRQIGISDAQRSATLRTALAAVTPFDHLSRCCAAHRQGTAAAQRQSQAPIAGLIVGAGEYEIAEPARPMKVSRRAPSFTPGASSRRARA